jgi:hypothetical protein
MEINNKSVRGIYLYTNDATFEPKDFVIYGTDIYICTAKSKGNIPQRGSEYFSTYPEDGIATEDDFDSEILAKGTNKLVTPYLLSKVLCKYMSGFDETGMIVNTVNSDTEIYIKDFLGNDTGATVSSISEYTNALDKILVAPDINNAIFKVKRDVVKYLIGVTSSDIDYIILRQFSYYYDTDELKSVRIQELIDEESGIIRYRYGTSTNNFTPSSWTSATVNPDFKNTVDSVISYYGDRIMDLEREKYELRTGFRFKSIPFSYSSSSYSETVENTITLSYGSAESAIPITTSSNITTSFPVTICTKYIENSTTNSSTGSSTKVWRTDSITVDIRGFILNDQTATYRIVGSKLLKLVKGTNNTISLTTTGGSVISDIYFRQTYESTVSDTSNLSVVNEIGFSATYVTGEGNGIKDMELTSISDSTSGTTVSIPAIHPNGCDLLVEAEAIPPVYNTTTSLYENGTVAYTYKFLIHIDSWSHSDSRDTNGNPIVKYYYASDYHSGCRIGVFQENTKISVNVYKTNPDTKVIDIGVPSQTGGGVMKDPQNITKIYYMS